MWKVLLLVACVARLTFGYHDVTKPIYKCRPNEVLSNCTNGGCEARNCSQAGKPVPCVKLDPKSCIKGCVCQPGYLRSANGTCVPQNQCNEGCGYDPNAHPGCGINCGRTCATYKTKDVACILICKLNGCDCNDGYVFDPIVKKCVLPKKCTPTCRLNEVFSNCTNGGCDARNCSQAGKPVPCVKLDPRSCIKGCVCQPGYLRSANGTCVPQNQCNEGCGGDRNAKPGCGYNCGKTCTTYKAKRPLCPRIPCKRNGCDCKDGYVFDSNVKKCVLPKKCITCGINEVYDICPAPCPPRRCDVDDRLIRCAAPPKPGDPACKPGCRCADGYARNATGTCVLREQCEPRLTCDQPNELYDSCPPPCPGDSCDVDITLVLCAPSPEYGDPACKPACRCIDGYARNADNVCVPRDQCPSICQVNEEYSNCTNGGCEARNCSQAGKPVPCVKLDPKSCIKGCVCQPGYLRSANGTCVPQNQCDEGCGNDPNAHPGCGVNCGRTCSTYKKKGVACILICKLNGCDCNDGYVFDPNVKKCVLPKDCITCGINEVYDVCPAPCPPRRCDVDDRVIRCAAPPKPGDPSCKPGCRCADGYARNANGTCVLREQCEQPPTCGLNEVYSDCTNGGCDARNCSQAGKPVPCVRPKSCIKGCVCQPGYLRSANGTCVPQNQCDGGCGNDPNAHPGCGVNCGRTCSTYKKKGVPCILICNLNGCDCNDGYVFDPNVNKCVLPKDCITCGINEVYDICPAPCPPRRCDVDDRLIRCAAPPKPGDPACKPGCRCADGYARNATGTCVLREQCEPRLNCDQPNELYDSCPAPCPGERCDVDLRLVRCAPRPEYGDPACNPGCRCIDGYARNAANECVPRDQCPCVNDPNAHPGCGVNCGRTCSTYKTKDVACVLICNLNGCDCNDGYVFDPNVNKCVLPEDCTPTCGLNEQYSSCTNGRCGHSNCSQLGQPELCIDVTPESCTRGCICASGYLRADNGTCVPQDECSTTGCGGDPNAKPGCGYNCGKTCTTYKAKRPICPGIVCKPNRCDCKDGYVFDDNVKKCVLPQECITCGINEVYDVCPAPCPPRRCDVDDRLIRCAPPPQPGDPECKPGCRCADGYARNATGTCVLREQCEPRLTCDQPNELYDSCPSACPGYSCDVDPAAVLCAPIPEYGDPACKPACRCIDGYARNAANECVPRDQCPSKNEQCTGQNEFFDTCISGCSSQSCDSIGKIFNCPIEAAVCRTGCRCNPGFYRNASDVCVSESQCPTPPCPEGEVYSRCPTVRCEGDYCPKNRDSPHTCPVGIVCDPPRCVCGPLDRRNRKTGKCIRAYDCPPFKCDGPNEEYQSCPANCPGDKCNDYIYNRKCPVFKIVVACKPQCRCKKGYYRNSDGICILASQCAPKTTNPDPTTAKPPTTASGDNGDGENRREDLEAGITGFNGKFLYNRIIASPGENIISSPCSVVTLLAQLALYAVGDSWKQLTSVLNLTSKQDIRKTFPSWADSFNGQTSVNFSTAAKVYSNQQYPLSDGFKKDSVDVVRADAQEVDFSKNTETANTINAWVESKTNNRIKDLIAPSDISALTRLVLVNAIYFKGDWQNPFNKNYTKEADFYLSDGSTKKTKLMFQEGYFNYGESPELNATILEIPYKGRNFSMIIVLPNEKDGVIRTAQNLQDAAIFNKVLENVRSIKVKVYVPPFEINTSTDLATILKQGGVTKIFDPKGSGLSGILKTEEEIYVSKAIQKAFIKVDETGSEAAAANAIVVGVTSAITPPRNIVFRCDRSFLYYIAFKRTVLFSGALVNPN